MHNYTSDWLKHVWKQKMCTIQWVSNSHNQLSLQSREKGRGTFQHRTNIEKGLAFLKRKSVRCTNSCHTGGKNSWKCISVDEHNSFCSFHCVQSVYICIKRNVLNLCWNYIKVFCLFRLEIFCSQCALHRTELGKRKILRNFICFLSIGWL